MGSKKGRKKVGKKKKKIVGQGKSERNGAAERGQISQAIPTKVQSSLSWSGKNQTEQGLRGTRREWEKVKQSFQGKRGRK